MDGGTYQCELRSINGVVSQVIHRVTVIGKCTRELRSINGVVSQVIHRVTVIGKCTRELRSINGVVSQVIHRVTVIGKCICELRSINGVVFQVIHRVTVIGKCTQVRHTSLLMQMRQLVAVPRRYHVRDAKLGREGGGGWVVEHPLILRYFFFN